MPENKNIIISDIQNRIYNIRGLQVMMDSDLAEIYGVQTYRLNEQVKRNKDKFPEDFMFQLTKNEWTNLISKNARPSESINESDNISQVEFSLRSHFAILKNARGKHRKFLPYVFTEQGVSSLSGVLKSKLAVKVNIAIMRAFVQMRKFISNNAAVFMRIENVEQKQIETDSKIDAVLDAIDSGHNKPKQGIFYQGQIFDAYVFVSDLIKSAKKSILLIDNYIDETILQLFTKRSENVAVTIYTKNITKILKQDLAKHNSQYPVIKIKQFSKAHDRFLIIDDTTVYHIGASLKDLGKQCFAFSRMDTEAIHLIANLKLLSL